MRRSPAPRRPGPGWARAGGGAPAGPVRGTGTSELLTDPLPSWPEPPLPQQFTRLVDSRAQNVALPVTMVPALLMLRTATGTSELLNDPLPSWPEPPYPQQSRCLLDSRAQNASSPPRTAVAVPMFLTDTGTVKVVVVRSEGYTSQLQSH